MSRDGAWNRVEIGGPAAAGFELVGCRIERGIAAGASIDTAARHVLVIRTGIGGFGTLLTENTELFYVGGLEKSLERSKLQASTFVQNSLPFAITFCDGICHIIGCAGAAKKRSKEG